MRVYLLIMVIAAAITFLLVPVARRLALALGAITEVRARDVHSFPIPRLGGVAMYAGFVGSFLVASQIPYLSRVLEVGSAAWGVLIGAGLMCLVGAIDDVWELDWYAKLAGEVLAAGVMAWQGVQLVTVPVMGLTVGSSRLTMFITVVAVVLVANAVNFVDGLDGLAAGIAGIAAAAFFVYSYALARNGSPDDYASFACVVVAALVGICAGFLPHNFHRARIFMGDSGALMLGVLIAAAGILVTGQIDPANTSTGYALPAAMPILVPIAVILLPLIDLVWAVVRRMARGQSPFQADAGHLHHRLLRLGHSHAGAVLVLYMWAAIASFTCVALVRFPTVRVAPIAAVFVVVGVAVTARQFRSRLTDGDDGAGPGSGAGPAEAQAGNEGVPSREGKPGDKGLEGKPSVGAGPQVDVAQVSAAPAGASRQRVGTGQEAASGRASRGKHAALPTDTAEPPQFEEASGTIGAAPLAPTAPGPDAARTAPNSAQAGLSDAEQPPQAADAAQQPRAPQPPGAPDAEQPPQAPQSPGDPQPPAGPRPTRRWRGRP